MKTERAVEVILEGNPFVECKVCWGLGYRRDKIQKPVAGMPGVCMGVPEVCFECHMTGKVVRPEYAEACKVLGRPLPKQKMLIQGKGLDTPLYMASNQQIPLRTVMNAMEALGMLPPTTKSR